MWQGIKSLGADSVFVGHEHANSAGVIYDGIRCQYGQKTGTYDRNNYLQEDGSYIRFAEDFSEIALPLSEIEELLLQSGFEIMDRYEYLTEKKGDENSEKVLFCCRKRK